MAAVAALALALASPAQGGVRLVKKIGATDLTRVGRTVLFTSGDEVWRSNGRREGTRFVRDLRPGRASSFPTVIGATSRDLFFWADDGRHGTELWTSDGTRRGTRLVRDIRPGRRTSNGNSSYQREYAVIGNTLYFVAFDRAGWQLWKSNGTRGGTRRVSGLSGQGTSEPPANLTAAGGVVYFTIGAQTGAQLWRSDGTGRGTVLLKDRLGVPPGPDELAAAGGALIFAAFDPSQGYELWRSNATPASTRLIREIRPGPNGSNPKQLTSTGGRVYFGARGGGLFPALWTSDGSAGGTTPVLDQGGQPVQPQTEAMLGFGGRLYLGYGGAGSSDNLLGRTGPRPDRVTPLRRVPFGSGLVGTRRAVYFTTGDSGLWRSDGTAAGTRRVSKVTYDQTASRAAVALGSRLLFSADGRLWVAQ